jgi:2-polyprenyl-6-hydroxyphenyl methylase/3-demethylubiquinone-9 3-methyltransferase
LETVPEPMPPADSNIDTRELDRFEDAAGQWWDLRGEYAALHHINPVRVRFLETSAGGLAGKVVLDAGCGGGILSEALAARGAAVTGIDMGAAALDVARRHCRQSGLDIRYARTTVEDLAAGRPARFDVVACMELLEHVPSPASVIDACARLLKPEGHLVVATLNRTFRSWFLAIFMAERILGIVSQGTHAWQRFLKPAEIAAWGDASGLHVAAATGLRYLPVINHVGLSRSMAVNYMMHLTPTKGQMEKNGF